jgi:Asp-tRNA(Asn)/Glu-tRNA(Gln) amidotransferase A subunit family amidase
LTDLAFASATELLTRIREHALSPLELMTATLDRIASVNGALNALVTLDQQEALSRAAVMTERLARGDDIGALAGLPLAVKDLEDAAGFPTTYGTIAFRDEPAAASDSIHVGRLRAVGAIVIGKTNTSPMGAALDTMNDAFGATVNPWNPDRSPGGSSGGSAAAVSAGLVPMATGGDGGGSARVPAALCGLPGLKPTRGRIPDGPATTPNWPHHSCLTALTRTVHDVALYLDIVAGYHPADPYSLPDPGLSYVESLARPQRPLRIGVCRTFGITTPEPAILAAIDQAAEVLRAEGHEVTDDDTPHPYANRFPESLRMRQQILSYNRLNDLADEFTANREDFEPWFAAILDRGHDVTAADLAAYWDYRGKLDAWAFQMLSSHDVLLTPTTPTTAWPAATPDSTGTPPDRAVAVAFTAVFNDTGHPAISMPAGLSDGLPCAVQLVAAHYREDVLLRLALCVERALGCLQPQL